LLLLIRIPAFPRRFIAHITQCIVQEVPKLVGVVDFNPLTSVFSAGSMGDVGKEVSEGGTLNRTS
jgi:hypothetical protein